MCVLFIGTTFSGRLTVYFFQNSNKAVTSMSSCFLGKYWGFYKNETIDLCPLQGFFAKGVLLTLFYTNMD